MSAEDLFRPADPSEERVVLLDDSGCPIGDAGKVEVHTTHTPLHLAFSTYLFNPRGELLLTRRALSKQTWPGVWTNSCCGHPAPGESLEDAARRRIRDELGMTVQSLAPIIPDFRYRAVDASGIVENEICPVFTAVVDGTDPDPNPDEVMDFEWVPWADVVRAVAATPQVYSPWCTEQIPVIASRLATPGEEPAVEADLAAALRDVDDLLRDQIEQLAANWEDCTAGRPLDVLPHDLPAWLAELVIGRGKRLRVAMCYWGFIAAGGTHGSAHYRDLVRAAAALETLHLFALVHDDIMDESTRRRGRPAAHIEAAAWHRDAEACGGTEQFGVNLAILLGDLAHALADQLVDALPRRVRQVWYLMTLELIAGQRADLTGAAAGRRDRATAEHIAQMKSGRYTVTRPLHIGAAAAAADEHVTDALLACGDHLGHAFALRDDYLGVWGDPDATGKPAGDDLIEAKATMLLALAEELLIGADRELIARVGDEDFGPEAARELADAMRAAGVADEVERMIDESVTAGLATLDPQVLRPAGIEGLRRAASSIAWRSA